MSASHLILGESLQGPENEPLRRKLVGLAETHTGGELHADSLFAAWADLRVDTAEAAPAVFLLFDLHRVIVYREPAQSGGARIGSVVRFAVDGYPFQPFELLAGHFGRQRFAFLYAPDSLDILQHVLTGLPEGVVATLSLATGEISRAPAHVHPEAIPVRRSTVALPPSEQFELGERMTGASLRAGAVIALEGLVSPVAAPVREVVETTNHASLPFGTARLAWSGGARKEFAGGKSLRMGEAALVATFEALERFQGVFLRPGDELVMGSYTDLRDQAVDPRSLLFGEFPHGMLSWAKRFSEHDCLHWTWAYEVRRGTPILVPAQEIWFNIRRLLGEDAYVATNSNGCAVGSSLEEAALFGLFETIERDAYLTTWYLRRPCRRIDPDSIRYEPFQLLRRRWQAAYPDYRFCLFDIGTDVRVPTVAAVALRERNEGPRTFHAAAAHLSAERACFGALKDLTGFTPGFAPGRLDEMRGLLGAEEGVTGPAGHYEFYALDESFGRLGFLDFGLEASLDVRELAQRAWIPEAYRYELSTVVGRLTEHLHELGVQVLLKDISHPPLAARGLRCIKVLTPGLFPIWFGAGARRFAVTGRLRRLAREYLGTDLDRAEDFNLDIHPFS